MQRPALPGGRQRAIPEAHERSAALEARDPTTGATAGSEATQTKKCAFQHGKTEGQSRNWLFGMPILVLGSRHCLMVKRLHTMGFILLISLLLEVDAHFKAAKPNSIELTLPRKDLRWSRADVQFYSTAGIGQVFSLECTTFLLDSWTDFTFLFTWKIRTWPCCAERVHQYNKPQTVFVAP